MKGVIHLVLAAISVLLHFGPEARAQGTYSMQEYERVFRHLGTRLEMLDPHGFFQRADFRPGDIMTLEFKGKTAPSLGIVTFETKNERAIDATMNFSPRFYTIYRIVPQNEVSCAQCKTEWAWTYMWRYREDRKWIGGVFSYSEFFISSPYGAGIEPWSPVTLRVLYRNDGRGSPVDYGTFFDGDRLCEWRRFSTSEGVTCAKP